jgi:hypothetical protein
MEYQILREDGKNILWLNRQYIGAVSDEIAERIERVARATCSRCSNTGWYVDHTQTARECDHLASASR